MNIAMIGLDTSHALAFTRLLNGPLPAGAGDGADAANNRPVAPEDGVAPADQPRVTTCLRFASEFESETNQDSRATAMAEVGVRVTRDFADAVAGCDAIMVEINDPRLHVEYALQAIAVGVPIFLDKPPADSVAAARQIFEAAAAAGVPLWSASSLRFDRNFVAAHAAVPRPTMCSVYAALGSAPAGSSVVWYGVHAAELVVAAMGPGAERVRAFRDERGVVAVISYRDGRRAVVELNRNYGHYGGVLHSDQPPVAFLADTGTIYAQQMAAVRQFFSTGIVPVPTEETLEVQWIINTIDEVME